MCVCVYLTNYIPYRIYIYIYIEVSCDHPSTSTCHYAHDQSSPTFALALLWARWKTTLFIHFCMLSSPSLSLSLFLALTLSLSLSIHLTISISLSFRPSVCLTVCLSVCQSVSVVRLFFALFFIFPSSRRDEDVGRRSRNARALPTSSLSRKSRKSNGPVRERNNKKALNSFRPIMPAAPWSSQTWGHRAAYECKIREQERALASSDSSTTGNVG